MVRIVRDVLMFALAGLALAGPAVAADTPGAAQASNTNGDDRIICRKTAEIGSLVRKKKECYTKAEWDKVAETHQRGARRLQEELRSKSSGQ